MLLSLDVIRRVPKFLERSPLNPGLQFLEKIKILLIASLGGIQPKNHGHGDDSKGISPENGAACFAV